MRSCGVLMPVFSLPSKYGIGGFSKEAYKFIDFLKKAGQDYWQILPLGPTGYGDSPYQAFSTFAGNPYFIDVDEFVERGYITAADCKKYAVDSKYGIDYEKLYDKRFKLLRLAFEGSDMSRDRDYSSFCKKNSFWLEDYALFMAIKDSLGGIAWSEWDYDIRVRKPAALKAYKTKLKKETDFYKFQQYFFAKQWLAVKKYANKAGVKIVGDIPIYVAYDSSDVWGNPELFDLDKDNVPNAVAGCPPDPFAVTGQLWGNPLYRWKYHKETGYEWWLKRISYCFELYDVVRIDHFRGFDEYYAIPYGDATAEFGKWRKGPGFDIFKAINAKLGDVAVIAEDLGFLTDSVRALVKRTGYPSMKVLEFAYGSGAGNEYLPHNLTENAVVYTGTHDNETVKGWYDRLVKEKDKTKAHIDEYLGIKSADEICDAMIRSAYGSVCKICIIPMQDWLGLGNEARINVPSTLGGNWIWRMDGKALTAPLATRMKKMKALYNR